MRRDLPVYISISTAGQDGSPSSTLRYPYMQVARYFYKPAIEASFACFSFQRKVWQLSANTVSLCTFFFEKKVRKKAIRTFPPKPPLKVQGGAYLPRQRHRCERWGFRFECQAVFDCAELLCLRRRDKAGDFLPDFFKVQMKEERKSAPLMKS